MKGKFFARFLALAVLLFAVAAAQAQLTTASIIGTVTDSTGAVTPGATVTATNVDTKFSRSTTSGNDGAYRLDFLPVGTYTVRIAAPGFEAMQHTGVVLTLNMQQNLNAALKPGSATESITVTQAPPLVQTTASSVGRTIDNLEVDNLPLVGRNVYDLINLAPGVQSNSNNVALGIPQYVIYVNGSVDNEIGSVSYYLDGGINMTFLRNTGNVLPNPDALQELNVMTNSFNALYGRSSSAIVNVVTKSGTNQLHGSIFEFFRSDKLNAFPYEALAASGKGHYHRNQFGATVGGPIIKDRTFFFGSYGGFRQNVAAFFNNVLVPTPAERTSGFTNFSDRIPAGYTPTTCPGYGSTATTVPALTAAQTAAGDFILCKPSTTYQNVGGTVNDPDLSNAVVPNNDLTQAGVPVDPTAINILKTYIPAPVAQNANGVYYWQGYLQEPSQEDEYLIKVDHNLTPNQRIEAAYFQAIGYQITNPGGNLPMYWVKSYYPYRQQNANLSDTWTISDHKVNQVWLNYTRMIGGRVNQPTGISLGNLGSNFQVVGTPSLPQITVSSYFTLGNAISGPLVGTNFYGLRDVFTWTKGKHNIGIGGELNLDKDMQNTTLNNYGVFGFNVGSVKSGSYTYCERTCNPLGDFVLGLNNSVTQDTGIYALDNTWQYGLFVQDDWRIRQNLTLNLGLRWDVQTPPTDPHDREAAWRPGVQSTKIPSLPTGLNVVGDPGLTRGIVNTRYHHVSPRIGFAWDPYGNGKTAVRGAFGVFYGVVSGNEWNATSNFQPFATRTSFATGLIYTLTDPYHKWPGGVSPFTNYANYNPSSYVPLLPNNVEGIDPNYQWPYSYQMNLSVQQQFSKDFSVTVSYIGNLQHNIPMDTNANAPGTGTGFTGSNTDTKRPLYASEQLQNVYVIQSGQSAHYHALQVEFDKRLSQHFSIKGYYTWSRTMESASLQNTTAQNNPSNFNNLREDYGRSDNDARHRSVTSVVWKPDYFTGFNRPTRIALNGWTIAATITVRSGNPFSVTTGSDTNLDGNNNDRVSYVPGVSISTGAGNNRLAETAHYINKAAF